MSPQLPNLTAEQIQKAIESGVYRAIMEIWTSRQRRYVDLGGVILEGVEAAMTKHLKESRHA